MTEHFTKDIFAGINTYRGYVPLLGESLKDAEEVYIIKGTPGSGKSTLMKRLYRQAKEKGENCLAIRCSSDPNSLDGVYFEDRKTAVADGTSPHVLDAEKPVLRDHIVDIIQYCDREALKARSSELESLLKSKKECFSKAYSSLYALGVIEKAMSDTAEECFDTEKIRHAAICFAKKRTYAKGGIVKLPMRCVCGSGFVSSLPEGVSENVTIFDRYGTSSVYMRYFCDFLEEKNAHCVVLPSPVDDKTPDAVFFPEEGLLVSTDRYCANESENSSDMLRFADRDALKNVKGKLGLYEKLRSELVSDIIKEMRKASEYHSEAERLYSAAFDFAKLDEVYEKLASDIFKE